MGLNYSLMTKRRGEITLHDLVYADIKIGDTFSFKRFIDEKMIDTFADLTSDYNPLHVDHQYAKNTEFGGRIAHGMLIGSLFSTLVGMVCPGKRALYLSQDLRFRNPLRPGNTVEVFGTVIEKFDALKVIEIQTTVKDKNGSLIVDGVAKVKIRDN